MEGLFPVDVLSRWLHVGTAIVLLGGTIFIRFVLMPAAEKLAPEAHETLRSALMAKWKIFVHAGIAVLLISGFYNFMVLMPKHRGDSLYHMLMGIKILLALGIFFLASVLVGRGAAFEKMRQNRKVWLGIIILLGVIVVAISSFVKVKGPAEPKNEARVTVQEPLENT